MYKNETNKVDISEKEVMINPKFNPFPGLRPFALEENHLFFGREGQSEEVLYNLSKNRFVAVIGSSGSGKSSLMYCGVVPILYGGFITQAGSEWHIIASKPGDAPINNLAQAISMLDNQLNIAKAQEENIHFKKALTSSLLRSSSLGLIEAIKQLNRPSHENFLILIDQFEELFRFKRTKDSLASYNESLVFVKNILEAVRQSNVPIYIILTMRSDFIGECSQFPELTDLINESHYLIPQMKRENYMEAITGPVAVGGGRISQRLLHQLLNDVGDNQDQLPILQHALMRTWDYWMKHRIGNEPMDIDHYDAVGRMEKALSEHANEAYDELLPKGKEICESIFKALTEKGSDNRGIRRPSSILEICEITEVSEDEIIFIVEKFRASGRSFLTASTRNQITKETIIDISHESLMRIWERLKKWVEEEAAAVQLYLRLSEAASMYQDGKTTLWRPPDLQIAINWRKNQNPNLAWAKRYDPAFERAMAYLDTSEKDFLSEEENKVRLQKRQLRRSRVFAIVLGVASIISIGLMLWSFVLQAEARKQKLMAEEQKSIAEEQRVIAEKESKEAERQKLIAVQNEQEALKQKVIAEKQKEIAEIQTFRAMQSAREALRQKEIADQKTIEAKNQKELADNNALEALEQKNLAEKASKRAENLRMLSVAQSMAVKSLQINNDKQLRALLAYQSYLFNRDYLGEQHHHDIFNGLYSSLKQLISPEYNHLSAHTDAVRSIVQDPINAGNFYSCGSDGTVRKWNYNDSAYQNTIIINLPEIFTTMAISKNGNWLALGTFNSKIYLLDLKTTDSKPLVFKEHKSTILSLNFIDNNSFISSASDTTIRFWNTADKNSTMVVNTGDKIMSLAVSPNNNVIAGASESGKLYIWNNSKIELPFILYDQEKNSLFSVVFNEQGSMLAASDIQGNIYLWETKDYRFVNMLVGHNARVHDVKFSRDNKYLASGGFDGSLRIWQLDKLFNQPIVIKDVNYWIWSIEFSENSELIYAGFNNGLIKWWNTSSSEMADEMCKMINRNMDKDEWSEYVASDIPYQKTCPNIP